MLDNMIEQVFGHGFTHFMNDLPGEIATVVLMKASHHAVKTVHGLHLIDRIKRVTIRLHTDESVSAEVTEMKVRRFFKRK